MHHALLKRRFCCSFKWGHCWYVRSLFFSLPEREIVLSNLCSLWILPLISILHVIHS